MKMDPAQTTQAVDDNDVQWTIQRALDEQVRSRGPGFYEPSPGQIWSHVSYRATRTAMDALRDAGYVVSRAE